MRPGEVHHASIGRVPAGRSRIATAKRRTAPHHSAIPHSCSPAARWYVRPIVPRGSAQVRCARELARITPCATGRAQGAQGVTTTRHMALALDDSTPLGRRRASRRQGAARDWPRRRRAPPRSAASSPRSAAPSSWTRCSRTSSTRRRTLFGTDVAGAVAAQPGPPPAPARRPPRPRPGADRRRRGRHRRRPRHRPARDPRAPADRGRPTRTRRRTSRRSTSGSGSGRSTSCRSCSATRRVGLLVLYHRRRVRLDARRARPVHDVRQPDGDRGRERPPVQLGPRGRGPPARDPGAVARASTGSRRSTGIGEAIVAEADRLIAPRHDPRLPRGPRHPDVRADRLPGRVRGDRHAVAARSCGSRVGEGLTGWVAAAQRDDPARRRGAPTLAAARSARTAARSRCSSSR